MKKSAIAYLIIWYLMISQFLSQAYLFVGRIMFDGRLPEYYYWMVSCAVLLAFILLLGKGESVIPKKLLRMHVGPRQLSSAVLMLCLYELMYFYMRRQGLSISEKGGPVIFVTQILCIVVLYLQNELFRNSAIQKELDIMNFLWKMEQEQYRLSRDNIQLINQKCHDMKHQIRALRHVGREEMDAYLDELEETVRIYEAIVKTGNDVLDTILTEKSLYCESRGITISVVADGALLDFIHTVDLYAILGNALDNAIEAVDKFREEEKRQIDVQIYKSNSFVVIAVMNPMSEELVYGEGSLPVTTKKDVQYHGYGLKSIKHFVKKYDGYMTITKEDGCFCLKMLIPMK